MNSKNTGSSQSNTGSYNTSIHNNGIVDVGSTKLTDNESQDAIESFVKFLQFETISNIACTNGEYSKCAQWLIDECISLNVFDEVYKLEESSNNSPVVIAIWKGLDYDNDMNKPTLPILLLNSHYDVVPVDEAAWTRPAFQGYRETVGNGRGNDHNDENRIYGRGTQDMKCVCIQYIHAIKKIRSLQPEFKPIRTIYLTFVPDEEVGGSGMATFLSSKLYNDTIRPSGIAIALDEGLASDDDTMSVFYGERLPWWVDVTATGPTGHGSRFIENTAVQQVIAMANKALEFRNQQRDLLGISEHANCAHAVARKNQQREQATETATTNGIESLHHLNNNNTNNNEEESTTKKKTLGDVTSLNITTLEAGVRVADTYAYNCVPPKAKCSFDIRISPHVPPSNIKNMLDTWCQECSCSTDSLHWSHIGGPGNKLQNHSITSTDPNVNPWYDVFQTTLTKQLRISIQTQVFPAATDSRFLRALGISALGFSPMRNIPILLHEHDEYITEHAFLEGITVYAALIHALATFQQ